MCVTLKVEEADHDQIERWIVTNVSGGAGVAVLLFRGWGFRVRIVYLFQHQLHFEISEGPVRS